MPVLDSHVFDMTRAIQLAVAPVFLLTAIGAIINALMGRLGRAVDRRRKLEELLSVFEGETRAAMERELSVLEKRIKLVFWAMAFAVLSALLVCVLIGTAFLARSSRWTSRSPWPGCSCSSACSDTKATCGRSSSAWCLSRSSISHGILESCQLASRSVPGK